MISIEICFPAGKLHATPWGRQVNEGAVEWPPSPWRFLRALISVWHNKFPDTPAEEVESLFDELHSLPSYHLPPSTSQGHTRHYMPTDKKPAKIFDTFLVIPKPHPATEPATLQLDASVIIHWPDAEPDDAQRELLGELVTAMHYLGRAETWIEARLLSDEEWTPDCNARPLNGCGVGEREQLVRVLAPTPPDDFDNWRKKATAEREAAALQDKVTKAREKGKPVDKVNLTSGDRKKIEAALPNSLFRALHVETNDLRKAGWNRPPGSQWVDYACPMDSNLASTKTVRRPRKTPPPTVARYAVTGRVVPRMTDALRIGERSRHFLMGCSKRANNSDNASVVFSGKTPDGKPLSDSHSHAHFLCESAAGNAQGSPGAITHLTVFAFLGFSREDEAALARFTRTWGDDGHDLQFVLLGIGQPEDFGGSNEKAGQSPILAKSDTWISRTPFVLPRHLKFNAAVRNDPEKFRTARTEQLVSMLQRELSSRKHLSDHADSVTIECDIMHTLLGGTDTPWLKFTRQRKRGHGSNAGSQGYGFRLKFEKPVVGPIALGYGCHFGLGQFVSVSSRTE